MKHFKSHNPGMSLLEVIAAIAILAIFGSSIFLMQQYLFDRMSVSQQKMIAHLRLQGQMVDLQRTIAKEFFEHGGVVEKSLQEQVKNFNYPQMKITTKTYVDLATKSDDKENSFTPCKDLCLLTVHAHDEPTDFGALYAFVYLPKGKKE